MKIIAEIGINHNGDIELAKKMIDQAKVAGCDYVKFQKRDVETCYAKEDLDRPRESPFGYTNREQKFGLEFDRTDYDAINVHCARVGMKWFASPWDVPSVEFLDKYDVPFIKVASAMVTNVPVFEAIRKTGRPVILSTGMSTALECKAAIGGLRPCLDYILACTSTYPTKPEEMNLRFIQTLKHYDPAYNIKIGFSNHSPGIIFCAIAAALGAEMIEYHMTLDRSMYGSDQASSIELPGMMAINKQCRNAQLAMGTGEWTVFDSEKPIRDKLRR